MNIRTDYVEKTRVAVLHVNMNDTGRHHPKHDFSYASIIATKSSVRSGVHNI